MQTIDLITVEEFEQFKKELIQDLKKLLEPHLRIKQWLRTKDVIKMLRCSPATLQNLRINGTIPYSRIGSILYYNAADIQKLLEDNYHPATSLD